MNLVRFLIYDLVGGENYVNDEVNGSFYGPHDNLVIAPGLFQFYENSPTLPKIRDMLNTQHIEFSELRRPESSW